MIEHIPSEFVESMIRNVPVYAICLKRKPASPESVSSWRRTFRSVTVVDAIDARHIDLETDVRVHDLVRAQVRNPDIAADSVFALPSKGAIGCALSHFALMRKCEKMNRPIVVLEQDVEFTEEATNFLRRLRIPAVADFVSLLYIRQPDVESFDSTFNRILGPHCDGMQCYYITPRGATKILDKAFPIYTQNDLLVGVVANTDSSFVALALRERLYSIQKILEDNWKSTIQHFRIKKYLPRSNAFYYLILILVFGWLLYVLIYA